MSKDWKAKYFRMLGARKAKTINRMIKIGKGYSTEKYTSANTRV
jgi:hypothetical protein